MATVTYFTVVGHYMSANGVDNWQLPTPDPRPINGRIVFTPCIKSGESLQAIELIPSTNLIISPVDGVIFNGDVISRATWAGDVDGCRLVANTEVLNLASDLIYKVEFFELRNADGVDVSLNSFYFVAPLKDEVIDLATVTPAPGSSAIGAGVPGVPGPQGPQGPEGPPGVLSINTLTAKAAPVDADVFPIADSQDAFNSKKLSWASVKSALKLDPTYEHVANKGKASGYAGLGTDSRVPSAQLTVSAVEYKGLWNAATNTPTLATGVGNQGDIYRVTTAGTQLGITVRVGDVVFYDGTTWHKLGAADAATYQLSSEKAKANGYASLDATTRLPSAQLPIPVVEYKGTWNAATNTPALVNGAPFIQGDMYRVTTAGTQLNITAGVGDVVFYDGAAWHKLGAIDAATSVTRVTVPSTAASTGTPGQISADSSFLYVCTATNTWRRVALSAW